VNDALTSIDQQSQVLCEDLVARIGETQRGLEVPFSTRTRRLHEKIDTKKDLHEELDRSILEARNYILLQTTKTQVKAAGLELRTQLKLVEARSELGPYQRTGACAAKLLEFDRTTSLAVFRRQFEIIAEHNCWTPGERATCLPPCRAGPPTCCTEPGKDE
jgi:hypothetical protein